MEKPSKLASSSSSSGCYLHDYYSSSSDPGFWSGSPRSDSVSDSSHSSDASPVRGLPTVEERGRDFIRGLVEERGRDFKHWRVYLDDRFDFCSHLTRDEKILFYLGILATVVRKEKLVSSLYSISDMGFSCIMSKKQAKKLHKKKQVGVFDVMPDSYGDFINKKYGVHCNCCGEKFPLGDDEVTKYVDLVDKVLSASLLEDYSGSEDGTITYNSCLSESASSSTRDRDQSNCSTLDQEVDSTRGFELPQKYPVDSTRGFEFPQKYPYNPEQINPRRRLDDYFQSGHQPTFDKPYPYPARYQMQNELQLGRDYFGSNSRFPSYESNSARLREFAWPPPVQSSTSTFERGWDGHGFKLYNQPPQKDSFHPYQQGNDYFASNYQQPTQGQPRNEFYYKMQQQGKVAPIQEDDEGMYTFFAKQGQYQHHSTSFNGGYHEYGLNYSTTSTRLNPRDTLRQ